MMGDQAKPVRQIRIAFWNLARLDTQPTLWGRTDAERWGALDDAAHQLNEQFGQSAVMTGAQLALREMEEVYQKSQGQMSVRAAARDGQKTLGHGRRPAGAQRRMGKTPGQGQQAAAVPALNG